MIAIARRRFSSSSSSSSSRRRFAATAALALVSAGAAVAATGRATGRTMVGAAAAAAAAAAAEEEEEEEEEVSRRGPSKRSLRVHDMCDVLQARFVERLSRIQTNTTDTVHTPHTSHTPHTPLTAGAAGGASGGRLALALPAGFHTTSWLRDGGAHGGGMRYQADRANAVFAQASVNVSAVHYEDKPRYPIDSATALSVILHPKHPHAPSMHFHISYMEPRRPGARPYWRMIADLNPAIPDADATGRFSEALRLGTARRVSRPLRRAALDFGDRYFYIPSRRRHRGAYHFFLGKLDEGAELSADACEDLAKRLAGAAIEAYAQAVERALADHPDASLTDDDYQRQLEYHTLYLFQVLTLDRGTTHGLLAHGDNDVGTLASLPPRVDRGLLAEWGSALPPQNKQRLMVDRVVATVPETGQITDAVRQQLADHVREHYRANPEAKDMQAELDLKGWMEGSRVRMERMKQSRESALAAQR